jgi:toxin ParE1/3/4
MLEIHKQALAEEDLIGIWNYTLKQWGAEQADTYLDQLNDGIAILAENPRLGINCDPIRQGYRRLHIKHHMVYYRITLTRIDLIRVLYEEMDPERHL